MADMTAPQRQERGQYKNFKNSVTDSDWPIRIGPEKVTALVPPPSQLQEMGAATNGKKAELQE